MCGIAGFAGPDVGHDNALPPLERMIRTLAHRGPDGYGFHVDAGVGLAHARLSIIDLSTGDQPIRNPDGTVWTVFNGEIFNYVELRRELEADGRRYSLDGGVGGLDYTHGYLARETSWRWAFVCGRLDDGTPIGINLVEGFNESRDDVNENALWLGNELIPLGRARFTWNPNAILDPWRVRTEDGTLELEFKPWAAHTDVRDLKLVKSSFKQPVGLWSGELKLGGHTYVIKDAPGVAEDQTVLW